MAEELGQAILELDVDQAPYIRGLADAKTRTATAVGVMQGLIDKLSASYAKQAEAAKKAADIEVAQADRVTAAYLREAEAARLAGEEQAKTAGESAAAGAAPVPSSSGGDRQLVDALTAALDRQTPPHSAARMADSGGIWGVRGPQHAGSLTNPIVAVIEAGKFAPMGSMAAAIGDSSMADQQAKDSPVASALDLTALADQVSQLAQAMHPAAQLAAAGSQGMATPTLDTPATAPTTVVEDPEGALLMAQAVQALRNMEKGISAHPAVRGSTDKTTSTTRDVLVPGLVSHAPAGAPANYEGALAAQAAADAAAMKARANYARTISVSSKASPDEQAAALAQREAAVAEQAAARAQTRAAEASLASHDISPGAGTSGGGGGGGGAGRLAFGVGGGGGGKDILGSLLKGKGGKGGHFGLPAFGSIGSLGGLGLEHFLFSGLGVGASAAAGAAGAGLLGAATLTQGLVGGGADALISKDTINQAKALNDNVKALNRAIAVYGAGSKQAAAAQYDLNQQWKELGGGGGKQAIVELDKNANALKHLFDVQSTGAREQAAAVDEQVLSLATTYTPLVTAAAQRNLTIVNTGLEPLFAWLKGPQGIGIFDTLENQFAKNLPTSIHAFDQGLEAFLKLMAAASKDTGGLSKWLDRLFTAKNAEGPAQYAAEVAKLVGDLHEWELLLKLLGEDVDVLFKADAGTGTSIVLSLTAMLQKLHDWESQSANQGQIENIFAVHKKEILALLQLLPVLMSGFGHFYLLVAPPIVAAFTGIADAIGGMLAAIEKISPATADLVGLALVMGKLGVLMPVLKSGFRALGWTGTQLSETAAATKATQANTLALQANATAASEAAGATADMTGAQAANVPVADADAAATGELAGAEDASAAGAGRLGLGSIGKNLSARGAKLGGASEAEILAAEGGGAELTGTAAAGAAIGSAALPVAGGLLAGSVIQHATGLKGGTAGTLGGGILGAGAGFAIGGPFGAAIGAGIGSTMGPTVEHLLSKLFGGGDYGAEFAKKFGAQFDSNVPKPIENALAKATAKAIDTANQKAGEPRPGTPAKDPGGSRPAPGGVLRPTATPAQQAAANRAAGEAAAKQWIAGYSEVKFPSTLSFLEGAQQALAKMAPKFRDAAAVQMLEYAQTLQKEGKLPQGAVGNLIQLLEQKFPPLRAYLHSQGLAMASDFANTMSMKQAVSNTQALVKTLGDEFGLTMFPDIKQTSGNMLTTVTGDFSKLRDNMGSLTKAGRLEAEKELKALQVAAGQDATSTEQVVSNKMLLLKKAIISGSSQAATSASASFATFANHIEAAMASGVLSTAKGTQLIAQALNAELKAFGQAPIPIVGVSTANLTREIAAASGNTPASANVGGGNTPAGHATGSKVTSPTYMVGEEGAGHPEYVVATNPAYRERNLGLWASAGKDLGVPGFAQGGFVADPGTQQTEGELPRLTAQLGALGRALGVTIYGISGYRSPSHSVAVGGFADDPHTRGLAEDIGVNSQLRSSAAQISEAELARFDLYRPFDPSDDPNNSEVNHIQLIDGGAGAPIAGGVGGGAGAAPAVKQIKTPTVSGSGTIADIARAGLKKVAAAANSYMSKQVPSGSGAGGVSGAGIAPGSWLQVARQLGAKLGWGPAQIQAWQGVEDIEDGSYSLTAKNPSSDAYGLAQFIDGPSEYASYGGNSTTLVGQLTAMANYIHQRYGTPAAALAHEHSSGFYAKGGIFDPNVAVWQVHSSDESYGGDGYMSNPIVGRGYSELSYPHGSAQWNALGHLPYQTSMVIATPDGKRHVITAKQDIGNGSSWDPPMGLYPQTREDLGTPSNAYVDIQRADGGPLNPLGAARKVTPPPGTTAAPVSAKRKGQLNAAKQAAKAKKKAPLIRQPKLKALSAFTGMDALTNLDTLIGQYGAQQGYLQSLNSGGAALEPLVTLADGSTEQINWGSAAGPEPSGMIDPATGQVTKGIYDRLSEIGAPGSMDPTKELGIEDIILATMLREQGLAESTTSALEHYVSGMQGTVNLETKQVAWLTQALDLTQPAPLSKLASEFKNLGSVNLGAVHDPNMGLSADWQHYSKIILDKVTEYRNAQALIDRWTTLKGEIPAERTARNDAITTSFETQRHAIATGSAKQTFTSGDLLAGAIAALKAEEHKALDGLPAPPPKGWKGDRTTWDAQHARERSDVSAEFSQREAALRAEAAKGSLTARLKQSDALFKLSQQESSEKHALSAFFTGQESAYAKDVAGERVLKGSDKTWLGNLRTAIKGQLSNAKGDLLTGQGDQTTLSQSYTDRYSPLAIDIETAQNVDSEPNVPGYLSEIANLKGTVIPPAAALGASATDSQLAGLLQQQLATAGQALAVSQAQYSVLSSLPPFGGSFAQGGIVPGPIGAARTIIAHGGEPILPVGSSFGEPPIVENHLHFHDKTKGLMDFVDLRIAKKTRQPLGTRRLPSTGGG